MPALFANLKRRMGYIDAYYLLRIIGLHPRFKTLLDYDSFNPYAALRERGESSKE
jgi:hypothetical protein